MRRALLLAWCCSICAAAEATQARYTIGVTAFADDNTVYHGSAGGAVRVYLSRHWSVEPEYLFLGEILGNHYDHVIWGNFAYDFRDRQRRVIPYWFGSPGVITGVDRILGRRLVHAAVAASTGVGTRVFVSERWFVAPQVRAGAASGVFVEATVSFGYAWRR